MNTRLGNQTVFGGIVAVLAIAILLGAKATLAAIATAVALLVLLMVLQGVRIARQEFSSRQPTDATARTADSADAAAGTDGKLRYDANGNVASRTDFNCHTITYNDTLNR